MKIYLFVHDNLSKNMNFVLLLNIIIFYLIINFPILALNDYKKYVLMKPISLK